MGTGGVARRLLDPEQSALAGSGPKRFPVVTGMLLAEAGMATELNAFYDDVRKLAKDFAERGRPDVAEQLDRAMYGSTSGEILSDIGAALTRVGPISGANSEQLERDVATVLLRIERMWGSAPY